jgi:hypothetical protein
MKNVYFLTALLFLSTLGFAQRNQRNPSLGFGVQIVEPKGQFAEEFDGYPAGLSGTFAAPMGRSPFEVGVSVAWNSMGSQKEDVEVYVYTDDLGNDIYEPGDMRIRSNNNRYLLLGRFRPFAGAIQPYVEGLTGFETFITKTNVSIDDDTFSDVANTDREHWDMALTLGWAGGLRIKLGQSFLLEARFENLQSGTTTFVDKETIQVADDNSLIFETRESRTDKWTYQLGIAFEF